VKKPLLIFFCLFVPCHSSPKEKAAARRSFSPGDPIWSSKNIRRVPASVERRQQYGGIRSARDVQLHPQARECS